MIEAPPAAVASDLAEWWKGVLRLCDEALFGIPRARLQKDALLLSVLSSQARTLVESVLDEEGQLYTPMGLMLAAACRRLGLDLRKEHWRAAVDNVRSLGTQVRNARDDLEAVGLVLGSPASIFKTFMDESLINAGLTSRPTLLDDHNREIALGLAVHWGMRFLLAYAIEVRIETPRPGRRDLAWIAAMVRRAQGSED